MSTKTAAQFWQQAAVVADRGDRPGRRERTRCSVPRGTELFVDEDRLRTRPPAITACFGNTALNRHRETDAAGDNGLDARSDDLLPAVRFLGAMQVVLVLAIGAGAFAMLRAAWNVVARVRRRRSAASPASCGHVLSVGNTRPSSQIGEAVGENGSVGLRSPRRRRLTAPPGLLRSRTQGWDPAGDNGCSVPRGTELHVDEDRLSSRPRFGNTDLNRHRGTDLAGENARCSVRRSAPRRPLPWCDAGRPCSASAFAMLRAAWNVVARVRRRRSPRRRRSHAQHPAVVAAGIDRGLLVELRA